jgi:hypothetical protein
MFENSIAKFSSALYTVGRWSSARKNSIENSDFWNALYLNVSFHDQLFSSMVDKTNAKISADNYIVYEEDTRQFVGIVFAMTIDVKSNIEEYWRNEDEGFKVTHRFFEKCNMSVLRFKVILKNWAMKSVFRLYNRIVIDESISWWHGKDEKLADGPQVLTLRLGPECGG